MERQTQGPLPKFRSPGTAPFVQLLSELGSLASVYHKPAASFVSKLRLAVQRADDLAAHAAAARTSGSGEGAWRGSKGAGRWVGGLFVEAGKKMRDKSSTAALVMIRADQCICFHAN